MKVFLIMVIFGKVVATAGPLPYDMNECARRADVLLDDLGERWADGTPPALDGKFVTIKDVHIRCTVRNNPPQVGEKFRG